jgi:transposase
MAYRHGDRNQITFLPQSIDEYVTKEDPVRAYDAFVDALNFQELGIAIEEARSGNSSYDPKAMMKLLVYGYSYGTRSSRKLERAVYQNLSFIWLMGGLKPDHKTIAEYRKNNKEALRKVLKQCARLCIKLQLIDGNTLFVDGTKIRANASIKNSWTKERCQKTLTKIDKRIDHILNECDKIDAKEQEEDSWVKMHEEVKNQEAFKTKVKDILKELKETDKKSINTVDSDCERLNSVQGTHASYNVQNVVDEKHGLILHTDVVNDSNDLKQFANQIDQANAILDKNCQVACADAGYSDTDELEKIDKKEIKVIVPSARQASGKEPKAFDKETFVYDSVGDFYICPEGHKLSRRGIRKKKKSKIYRITDASRCRNCQHFGTCTKDKHAGREINRLLNEEIRQKFEKQYEQPESQEIYKLRKQKVELPFGHKKRNLKVDAFLIRGFAGVEAESALLSTCFNLSRMITILGVTGLIAKIAS